jgi:hypothetical protein
MCLELVPKDSFPTLSSIFVETLCRSSVENGLTRQMIPTKTLRHSLWAVVVLLSEPAVGAQDNFLLAPLLPHKCGVPTGYGTPHLCGSEELCRALTAEKRRIWRLI